MSSVYNECFLWYYSKLNNFSKNKIFWVFGSTETDIIDKLQTEYGVKPEEVTSIGAGGYILKEYYNEFINLIDRHFKEKHEYTLSNIYEVVNFYCWDYELYISMSYDLDSLLTNVIGLSPEEIQANSTEIQRAYRDYKREFEKLNL